MFAFAASAPFWADAGLLSWSAIVIAFLAAAFTGWQAIIAHRSRVSSTERALVEWEPPEWPEPEVIEIRSKGPDEARRVWARLTVKGESVEVRARRVRQGQALRFTMPGLGVEWELHALLEPRGGEDWDWSGAFGYGGVITWRSRYGRQGEDRLNGIVRRKVRTNRGHDPFDKSASGMPF
jgi:hypothetical protein